MDFCSQGVAAREAAKPSVVDAVRSSAYKAQGVCVKAAEMYIMVMVTLRKQCGEQ